MTDSRKIIRHFSSEFKKEKVRMLETGQITVRQLSTIYEVSESAIYLWKKKYSSNLPQGERLVVEKESEGSKLILILKRQAELERQIGKQQMEIIYLKEVISKGSELIGEDIEKKFKCQ